MAAKRLNKSALIKLIKSGENINIEFKKSTNCITRDVYDTVCSFSNRDGGIILLGVNDSGDVLGVAPESVEKIKKDFVTNINNGQKFYPPLYLQPEEYTLDGKILLLIRVPVNNQVCRHNSRIFDRTNESDIDITNNTDLVYQLYARKSSSYFVNKLTPFGLEDLRSDLIRRAKLMAVSTNESHPWSNMTNIEILRSSGLVLRNEQTQKERVTIAGVLLFGKDTTIMSVLPQHKTDALKRVNNTDRYDDRDVIITNLLETYDRLLSFGHKHLEDPFFTEGVNRVSVRDKILREIFSNSLAHRDYSSPLSAMFVIERDKIYTENANISIGNRILQLTSFHPISKNPPISKVFREIGLADELGSGLRNTYKYTKFVSDKKPEFIEGDVFKAIIPYPFRLNAPINNVETSKCTEQANVEYGHIQNISIQTTTFAKILEFCNAPRSRAQIAEHCGYQNSKHFSNTYLKPLIATGKLIMTIPDKPKSKNQRYFASGH